MKLLWILIAIGWFIGILFIVWVAAEQRARDALLKRDYRRRYHNGS